MIKFDNVSCKYSGDIKVTNEINFDIAENEKVGLIGANGAGKTTLMKSALGLVAFDGKILIDDLAVCKENIYEIRKMIGYVFQNSDEQMFMPTVFDDIIFAPINYGASRDDAEKKADSVLEHLEISHLKSRSNHTLSAGEKRMAAIATILAMEPKIIFMDEPSLTLDPKNRRRIINVINALNLTMIIASHDLDLVYDTCDRVILLSDGKVIISGDTKTILRDKKLLDENGLELPLRFYEG